jgi:DNA-binding transcriptional regulator LsrR (DeoR family)
VQFKIATEKDIADYVRRGAVGIIAGRFVDADGRPVLGELDDRLISADHETLRAMTGLLVVSGLHKLEPTRAALKGGYVNEMVVDTVLAEALLAA